MLINIIRNGADITTLLMYILSSLIVIFLVLPVHEFAHGLVAVWLGDKTPRYEGRLTLNPLAHIDYIGAAAILIFGFGWAKPVRVNMRNFKKPKLGMAITALAGPLSNIIFAFISLCILKGVYLLNINQTVFTYIWFLLYYLVVINIALAVFNLIPIPPLDGSRLLNVFLPDRIYYRIMQYEQYLIIGVLVLLWVGVLDIPMEFLRNLIFSGLDALTYFIFGIKTGV